MPTRAAQREQLVRVLHDVRPGQFVYATPASIQRSVSGRVVEVDRLTLALETDDIGIVWVHGEDCPDLLPAAAS